MEVNFRKIDIDQYDEDVLHDSELYEVDPRNPAEVLNDAKQRQIAVRGLLAKWFIFYAPLDIFNLVNNRNDIPGALTIILDNAPYGLNVDEAKV